MKYLLNTDSLLAGDILLTSERAPISKGVRIATGAKFSHAMLYVGSSSYIHSDGAGVHSGNLQRLLFEQADDAKVMRLKDRDEQVIQSLCAFARAQIGKQYSRTEAIRSKVRRNNQSQEDSNRQFCSRLVAQAYHYAGVGLVNNKDYCYPKDIEYSPLLNVVEGYIKIASPAEVKFAESESPLEAQTKATNLILGKARELSGEDIQTLEQLAEYLLRAPKHDIAITSVVEKSGYLDFWKMEYVRNPWRYESSIFLGLDIPCEEKKLVAENELVEAEKQLKQFEFMYNQCYGLWSQLQLKYFSQGVQLYMNLMELMKKRKATALEVLGKI